MLQVHIRQHNLITLDMCQRCVVHTCINSSQYTLHGVCGGVPPCTGFPALVALGAEIKVVADQTLVTFTRKAALTTGIAADTLRGEGRRRGRSQQ